MIKRTRKTYRNSENTEIQMETETGLKENFEFSTPRVQKTLHQELLILLRA